MSVSLSWVVVSCVCMCVCVREREALCSPCSVGCSGLHAVHPGCTVQDRSISILASWTGTSPQYQTGPSKPSWVEIKFVCFQFTETKSRNKSKILPSGIYSCFCVFLLCIIMALKVNWNICQLTSEGWDCKSCLHLWSCSISQMTRVCSASGEESQWGQALQHVIMPLVVLIISVVIEIWTVVCCCHEGEGAFVVLRVQWFLFNADVMPVIKHNTNRACYSYSIFSPLYPCWTFQSLKKGKQMCWGSFQNGIRHTKKAWI